MKKLLLLGVVLLGLGTVTCKKEKAENPQEDIKEKVAQYAIDAEASKVVWTAYKTSDKVPVSGTFKKVELSSQTGAASPKEALNGLEFEIPVSSIFSNDSIRDGKLQKFFFNVMDNTVSLKGKFLLKEDGDLVEISMNGVQKALPIEVEQVQDTLKVSGTLDILEWNGEAALNSINEACKLLHTGADGVSKTWNDVAIAATIVAQAN